MTNKKTIEEQIEEILDFESSFIENVAGYNIVKREIKNLIIEAKIEVLESLDFDVNDERKNLIEKLKKELHDTL